MPFASCWACCVATVWNFGLARGEGSGAIIQNRVGQALLGHAQFELPVYSCSHQCDETPKQESESFKTYPEPHHVAKIERMHVAWLVLFRAIPWVWRRSGDVDSEDRAPYLSVQHIKRGQTGRAQRGQKIDLPPCRDPTFKSMRVDTFLGSS